MVSEKPRNQSVRVPNGSLVQICGPRLCKTVNGATRACCRTFAEQTHHDIEDVDPNQHGSDGPIHTTALARKYPLKNLIWDAFLSTGLAATKDANGGNPLGVAPYRKTGAMESVSHPEKHTV